MLSNDNSQGESPSLEMSIIRVIVSLKLKCFLLVYILGMTIAKDCSIVFLMDAI